MAFELMPLVGPLPLRFGMTRAEVNALIDTMEVPSAYANSKERRSDLIGVYPNYDAKGRLDFVDLSSRCLILYHDEDILDMPADETVGLFAREFGPYQEVKSTYRFAGPCFLLSIEDGEEGDEVRVVSVCTRDHYDRRFAEGE